MDPAERGSGVAGFGFVAPPSERSPEDPLAEFLPPPTMLWPEGVPMRDPRVAFAVSIPLLVTALCAGMLPHVLAHLACTRRYLRVTGETPRLRRVHHDGHCLTGSRTTAILGQVCASARACAVPPLWHEHSERRTSTVGSLVGCRFRRQTARPPRHIRHREPIAELGGFA